MRPRSVPVHDKLAAREAATPMILSGPTSPAYPIGTSSLAAVRTLRRCAARLVAGEIVQHTAAPATQFRGRGRLGREVGLDRG